MQILPKIAFIALGSLVPAMASAAMVEIEFQMNATMVYEGANSISRADGQTCFITSDCYPTGWTPWGDGISRAGETFLATFWIKYSDHTPAGAVEEFRYKIGTLQGSFADGVPGSIFPAITISPASSTTNDLSLITNTFYYETDGGDPFLWDCEATGWEKTSPNIPDGYCDAVGYKALYSLAPIAPVPLPAGLPLLVGALGVLALGRRATRS